MKKINLILLVVFFFLSASFIQRATAVTLLELDQSLTKAADLNQFLASPTLIEEYFQGASHYYGSQKFSRKSYDAILNQMRLVVTKFPEFSARAWETDLGQPFKVKSIAPTYGRQLNMTLWTQFLVEFKASNKSLAGDLFALETSEAIKRIEVLLKGIQAKVDQHEAEMQEIKIKKSDKLSLSGKFFQELKQDPDLEKITSYIVGKYFTSEIHMQNFESGSPDLIINALKNLSENPKLLFKDLPAFEYPDLLASAIKHRLPDAQALLKVAKIFPLQYHKGSNGKNIAAEGNSPGEWSFVPSPRRFHAFFKGIMDNECVGGDPNKLESLSPERWGTIILKGSQFHYVEKEGKFQGWVQAIPVAQNGQAFASVDFASLSFRKAIISKRENGSIVTESMLSGWLREAMKYKPASWKGFVVGQSNAINNGGALPTVKSSPSYILGEKYDPKVRPFAHMDPNTVQIMIGITQRVRDATQYGGNMIFDAAVPNAGILTELKVVESTLYEMFLSAVKKKDLAFVNASILTMHNSAMSDLGRVVISLREAGVLKLLVDNKIVLPRNVVYYTTDPKEYVKTFVAEGLTIEEIKLVQRLLCVSVDETMAFTRGLLASEAVYDLDTYIKALAFEVETPHETYKLKRSELIIEGLANLFKLFPEVSLEQALKLEKLATTIQSGIAVLNEFLKLNRSKAEILMVLATPHRIAGDAYDKAIAEVAAKNFSLFFSMSPNSDETMVFAKLSSIALSAAQKTELQTYMLGLTNTKEAQLAVFKRIESKEFPAEVSIQYLESLTKLEMSSEVKAVVRKLAIELGPQVNLTNGWEKAYQMEARLAQNSDELVSTLTRYKAPMAEFITIIAKTLELSMARLIEMKPSYSQLLKVLKESRIFEAQYFLLLKPLLSTSSNIEEFMEPLKISQNFWKTTTFINGRVEALNQHLHILIGQANFSEKIDELLVFFKEIGAQGLLAKQALKYLNSLNMGDLTPEMRARALKIATAIGPSLDLSSGWKENYQLRARLAQTSEEIVNVLTLYKKSEGDYIKAIAETTQLFLPQLLELKPTYSQLLRVFKESKIYEASYFLLLNELLHAASNIDEFVEPLKISKSFWTTSTFISGREAALQKHLPQILKYVELSEKIEAMMPFFKEINAHSLLAKMALEHLNSIKLDELSAEKRAGLLKIAKTIGPQLELSNGWEKAYRLQAQLAQTSDELVSAMTFYKTATGEFTKVIASATQDFLPQLIQMGPSYAQLLSVLKGAKIFQASCITLLKELLRTASTLEEFMEPLKISETFWTDPGYTAARLEVLKAAEHKLLVFENLAEKAQELEPFFIKLGMQDWFENLLLKNVTNRIVVGLEPAKQLEVLLRLRMFGSEDFRGQINLLARHHFQKFILLNPESKDAKNYRETFFSITERAKIFFKIPIQILPEAGEALKAPGQLSNGSVQLSNGSAHLAVTCAALFN